MAAFEYLALDERGRARDGVIYAASESLARDALQKRRLVPTRIVAEIKPKAQTTGRRFRSDRIGTASLALVTRQLATLIRVVPLDEALRTIAMQIEKPLVRRVLLATHASVQEGFRLSDAMTRQGSAYPPLYRAMVSAGEASSALPEILERLANLLEREQEVRGKMLTTLIYPIALAATSVIVIIALMTFVVPKVVDQFDSMGQTLPLLTRIIIFISESMRDWGWLALLVLLASAFAAARALRVPATRRKVDAAILRLPFIGRLVRDLNAARLARTLSTMIASGMPLIEGLALTARTVNNHELRAATEEMVSGIREGGSLSSAMKRAGIFPPILVYMASSGESSGKLEAMLASAAEYLEREFNTFTSVALSLLEPAIIIVMGAVVATIVLSILLPILQINTLTLG